MDTIGGRYGLRRLVDGGGAGEVWQADDIVAGGSVAVKVYRIPPEDTGIAGRRFVAEATVLARLRGPGIVDWREVGCDGDRAYVAMPLLDGEPLRALLHRTPILPPAQVMALIAEAAAALAISHRAGIVHRGVRPSRLFLPAAGGLVLTEFGLGWLIGLPELDPTYLAPEQARGETGSVATDLYRLGLVGYECLAGRPPFLPAAPTAAAQFEVVMQHIRTPPPPLPPSLPAAARAVVVRALAKAPADRWPDAAAMAGAARAAIT